MEEPSILISLPCSLNGNSSLVWCLCFFGVLKHFANAVSVCACMGLCIYVCMCCCFVASFVDLRVSVFLCVCVAKYALFTGRGLSYPIHYSKAEDYVS